MSAKGRHTISPGSRAGVPVAGPSDLKKQTPHATKRRHVKNNLNHTRVLKESLETEEIFKRYGHFSDIPVGGTLLEVDNNFRMDFLRTQLSEPFQIPTEISGFRG